MGKGKKTDQLATVAHDKPDTPTNGNYDVVRSVPITLPGFWIQALGVALLAIFFYGNTVWNEYALDDTAVIVRNEFVHQGLAGIPDIFTKDVYFSYYSQIGGSDQLAGGRYRPLPVATYALEQQFFGIVPKNKPDSIILNGLGYQMQLPYEKRFLREMHIRHAVNVVLFAVLGIALFYLLYHVVFRKNPVMALVAAILFVIHPLHTEVVANVKSRDELLSLLFICLTFIFSFRYQREVRRKWLFAALVSCILAFLSKEYAITLLVLLPVSFYVFENYTIKKCFFATLPFLAVALLYILLRLQVIGSRNDLSDNDIQINPYALASGAEKLATEIATSLNYIKLLFFPHPLCSDYSYNQIPYKDFSNPIVWLSVFVHAGMFTACIYFIRIRHVLGFALAFYLINLLMVCNIVFDIGATMGERLIFHASVGFVIVISWLLVTGISTIRGLRVQRTALAGVLVVVIALSACKTIERNKDWKNDSTLFFKDIEVSPNSFLVNVNVATMLVNQSDYEKNEPVRIANLRRGIRLYTRVINLQDNYVLGYLNRSIAYLKLGEADSMVADLERVKRLYPIHPQLPEMYYHAAMLYIDHKDYPKADSAMHMSQRLNPNVPEVGNAIRNIEAAAAGSTK